MNLRASHVFTDVYIGGMTEPTRAGISTLPTRSLPRGTRACGVWIATLALIASASACGHPDVHHPDVQLRVMLYTASLAISAPPCHLHDHCLVVIVRNVGTVAGSGTCVVHYFGAPNAQGGRDDAVLVAHVRDLGPGEQHSYPFVVAADEGPVHQPKPTCDPGVRAG